MIRKWFGLGCLIATGMALLSLASCARGRKLTSINIMPGNGTFANIDPALYFTYKAYGTYIHPPQTLDITSQVSWQTDNPQVVQFTSPGVISPNTNCGVAQIYATMHNSSNDVVSNQVSITVDGPASLGCPQGNVTFNLSLDVTGGANGVITSSPAGIDCGSTCSAPFPAESSVALTASPNTGHSFGGWGTGCTSISGTTCNVTMSADVTISATFN